MKLTSCCNQKTFKKIDLINVCTNTECNNYFNVTTIYQDFSIGWFGLIGLIGFLLLFPCNQSESNNTGNIIPVYYKASKPAVPELTMRNVKLAVEKMEIICPDQVTAQIKLESGNLNSWLLKKTNNMLGMRFPYVRTTSAIGLYLPAKDTIILGSQKELLKYRKESSYAVYETWMDAIQDYKYWQDETFNVKKRYIDFLKKNYAEDPLYIDKVLVISEKLAKE